MGGIARYAQGQRRMAERIRDEADKISQVKDAPSASDATELPKDQSDLETKFAWDRRIFQERSQSLTYVCEVPQLLEQRLGDIARMIQAQALTVGPRGRLAECIPSALAEYSLSL